MDWTAEEMKELKCFLFGQPLRPTRAHDISPIMRLEFGVFGDQLCSCISESSLTITLSPTVARERQWLSSAWFLPD
jgi:hypothetical protein